MELDWARSLIAQCRNTDVAVFMKQTGRVYAKRHGFTRDPIKGGDPGDWPTDLRVREFPCVPEAVSDAAH